MSGKQSKSEVEEKGMEESKEEEPIDVELDDEEGEEGEEEPETAKEEEEDEEPKLTKKMEKMFIKRTEKLFNDYTSKRESGSSLKTREKISKDDDGPAKLLCIAVNKSGQRKDKVCNLPVKKGNDKYCQRHHKCEDTVKKKMDQKICEALLSTGNRKGQRCTIQANSEVGGGRFCKRHSTNLDKD